LRTPVLKAGEGEAGEAGEEEEEEEEKNAVRRKNIQRW